MSGFEDRLREQTVIVDRHDMQVQARNLGLAIVAASAILLSSMRENCRRRFVSYVMDRILVKENFEMTVVI
jgi:hypothetical protein